MYNHLFLPHCGHSSGTAWKGHYMTSHPWGTPQQFLFQKHTYFQAYKLFTLYYPAKLRKYTAAACWDFFHYRKKKEYIETFKEYRQNS